jgi:hypothetical protein
LIEDRWQHLLNQYGLSLFRAAGEPASAVAVALASLVVIPEGDLVLQLPLGQD